MNEVQEVYRLQGVKINDKHIEVIVRQMLRKAVITKAYDSEFLEGEQVEVAAWKLWTVNVKRNKPPEFERELLGITKASLATDPSFLRHRSKKPLACLLKPQWQVNVMNYAVERERNRRSFVPAGTGFAYHRRHQGRKKYCRRRCD